MNNFAEEVPIDEVAERLSLEFDMNAKLRATVMEANEFYRALIWNGMRTLEIMNEIELGEFDGTSTYTELVDAIEERFTK